VFILSKNLCINLFIIDNLLNKHKNMASPEKAFIPPGVDPDKLEAQIAQQKPDLRVVQGEGGGASPPEKLYVPTSEQAGMEAFVTRQPIKTERFMEQETRSVADLLREDAAQDVVKAEEIRGKIELPEPTEELTEADFEPITGVEYLNAQPGGEKVTGSTYESTSDKVRTLRQTPEQNSILRQQAEDMTIVEESEENALPRFPLSSEEGGKDKQSYESTSEKIRTLRQTAKQNPVVGQARIVQEAGELPRFESESDLDKAA
jgi:hypothetical protein